MPRKIQAGTSGWPEERDADERDDLRARVEHHVAAQHARDRARRADHRRRRARHAEALGQRADRADDQIEEDDSGRRPGAPRRCRRRSRGTTCSRCRCSQPAVQEHRRQDRPRQRQQVARADVDPVDDLVRDRPARQHQRVLPAGVERQLEQEHHHVADDQQTASPPGSAMRGLWSRSGNSTRFESDHETTIYRVDGGSPTLTVPNATPITRLEMRLYSGKIPTVGSEIVKSLVEAGDIEVTDRGRGGDGRAGGAQGVHPARSRDHREDQGRPAEAQPALRAVRQGQAHARRREGASAWARTGWSG